MRCSMSRQRDMSLDDKDGRATAAAAVAAAVDAAVPSALFSLGASTAGRDSSLAKKSWATSLRPEPSLLALMRAVDDFADSAE